MKQRLSLSKSSYESKQNGRLIDASALKIKVIDEISPKDSHPVRHLILAHNLITKIQNMRQFTSLIQFDISYNVIRDGNELLKLLQLQKLIKVKVKGNPFLQDPLSQEVLQFLLQKQTDIEILSGEALNQLNDLQQGELKVVFLQNYLRKMSCHDQILSRKPSKQSRPRSLINQQHTNRNIINKIMPQYYPIISDPKLNTQIKKQTVSLKKQQQVTFQQAMARKKEKQQKQVDNLIKDILLLVEEQDQDRIETHQFQYISNQREQFLESPQKLQIQQVGYKKSKQHSIIKQKSNSDIRNRKEGSISNSLRKKFQKFSNRNKQQQFQKSITRTKYFKAAEQSFNEFQNSIPKSQSFQAQQQSIKEQNQKEIKLKSKRQPNQIQAIDFYSFNRTIPMPFNKIELEIPKQTQRKQNKSNLKTPLKIQIFPPPPQTSSKSLNINEQKNLTKNSQSKLKFPQTSKSKPQTPKQLIDMQFHSLTSDVTPSHFYEQYYNHLTKYNPTFALLYSDIATLSSQQKSVLIQALSKDHKQKTVQLFLQQSKLKKIKQLMIQNSINHEKQVQNLLMQIQEQIQVQNIRKNYTTQIQKQNTRLNQLIKGLSEDITKIKQENWEYKQNVFNNQNKIKVLQDQAKSKKQYLLYLEKCQDQYDIIYDKMKSNLKRKYIHQLNKRAQKYQKIRQFTAAKQKKQAMKLKNMSWSLLKRHLLLKVLSKMKQQQKNNKILKLCFGQWKKDAVIEKNISGKIMKIKQFIIKKSFKTLVNVTGKRLKFLKENQLHKFWADQHFLKSYFYKLHNRSKQSSMKNNEQLIKAQNFREKTVKKNMLKCLQKCVQLTKQKCLQTINFIMKNRKQQLYYQWKTNHNKNLFKIQKINNINLLGNLLKKQLEYRRKNRSLKKIIKYNRQIKEKTNQLKKINLHKNLMKFKLISKNILTQKQNTSKANKTVKTLLFKKLIANFRLQFKRASSFKNLVQKYKKQISQSQLLIQKKSALLQQKLNLKRSHQVFYKLLRNLYYQKITDFQINQRIQAEQTQQFFQKMKNIQEMQVQAIKIQHNKHLKLIQQQQIQKQVQYRENLMIAENNNIQLQNMIKIMRNQIQGFKQRQKMFYKEKQIMNQELNICQQWKDQMEKTNQNLRIQISNITQKYDRMLEGYTKAVLEIEKKDKILQPTLDKLKQLQKIKQIQKLKEIQRAIQNEKNKEIERIKQIERIKEIQRLKEIQRIQRIKQLQRIKQTQKIKQLQRLQKSRLDKTVQKQKRPTGVVRNGDFISLRNRLL